MKSKPDVIPETSFISHQQQRFSSFSELWFSEMELYWTKDHKRDQVWEKLNATTTEWQKLNHKNDSSLKTHVEKF